MSTQYNFHASALGVGGFFVREGRQVLVPSLASVALSPDGGEGSASVTNYNKDGISLTRADSRVTGYETSRNFFTTRSEIYISNLSVLEKVKIGLLHATVTSTRNLNDPVDEAEFQLDAVFFGIDVFGVGVIPKVDVRVTKATYKDILARAIARITNTPRATPAEQTAADAQIAALNRGEPIRDTLLESMTYDERKLLKEDKHVVKVPGFAKLHFGELLVKRGRRRVNLLRFEFDNVFETERETERETEFETALENAPSQRAFEANELQPSSGSLTVASGDGNGEPVWPRG